MRNHVIKFERTLFAALAVVTTTTIGILLHATFSMTIVA
jgi:hypothetical protein